jgi:aminoglycoside phosphotransferase (APT) family kinase protein
MKRPPEPLVVWAKSALGADSVAISALGSSQRIWLLYLDRSTRAAVLKMSEWKVVISTSAAALAFAEEHGLPAPRLIAAETTGDVAGSYALLETRLPGTSTIPRDAHPGRLRDLGAAAAALHTVPLGPGEGFERRTRPTTYDHHDANRRWAMRYRATPDRDKPALLEAQTAELRGLTGWDADQARDVLLTAKSTDPLLAEASDRLNRLDAPEGSTVFVHGDLWQGNTMWANDRLTGFVDWDAAGAGHPGIDLGALRLDAALCYGLEAADAILDGWQQASGRAADDQAYWDLTAALNTADDLGDDLQLIQDQGRPDLDIETRAIRRNALVEAALERL